jgi:hypothetical protein
MGDRVRDVIVSAVVLALLSVLAACGSGPSLQAGPSASGVKAAAFANTELGFTLDYPASFVKVEPSASPGADSGLLYQVYFADPSGAKSGGSALDGLGVTVRSMSRTAKPGDLKTYRGDFENMALLLTGKPDGLKIVEPFRLTTLGGQPALKGIFTSKVNGADVATVAYLVPHGDRVYWVTGQASRQTWSTTGRELGAALATLKFE